MLLSTEETFLTSSLDGTIGFHSIVNFDTQKYVKLGLPLRKMSLSLDGDLVVLSEDNKFFVMDQKTNHIISSFALGKFPIVNFIFEEKMIYFSDTYGKISITNFEHARN